ncbi:MAG: hypothetical protein M1833_002958 [Piccolia ochrophora]|nr:MAG: hypothetical protein M1833_002958 [Piccolia ochrophora]
MEVAAAASISSLIALTGQTIDALFKLSNFFRRLSHIFNDLQTLLEDLASLRNVLQAVERTARRAQSELADDQSTIDLLHKELQSCRVHLQQWMITIREVDGRDEKALSRWWKKFRAAGGQARLRSTRDAISSHRAQIAFLLNIVASEIDLRQCGQLQHISADLGVIQNQQHDSERKVLDRVDSGFEQIQLASRQDSIQSRQRLDAMQAGILAIQQSIEHSVSMTRYSRRKTVANGPVRKARKRIHQLPYRQRQDLESAKDLCSSGEMPLRLIKTAMLLEEHAGQIHTRLVATADPQYEGASSSRKAFLVQSLLRVRLLLWLFTKTPPLRFTNSELFGSSSFLVQLAGLNCRQNQSYKVFYMGDSLCSPTPLPLDNMLDIISMQLHEAVMPKNTTPFTPLLMQDYFSLEKCSRLTQYIHSTQGWRNNEAKKIGARTQLANGLQRYTVIFLIMGIFQDVPEPMMVDLNGVGCTLVELTLVEG